MFSKLHGVVPFFFFLLLLTSRNCQGQSDANIISQNQNTHSVINSFNQNEYISSSSKVNIYDTDNIRSILFWEDFTGKVLPAGWTNISNNSGTGIWQFDNPNNRIINGTFDKDFAILDSDFYGPGNSQDATLTTPAIDASSLSTVVLGFYQQFKSLSSAYGLVEVSNDSLHWILLDSITVNTGFPDPVYTQYDVTSLASGKTQVYFRWTYVGAYSYYWAIDNVVVFKPEPYPNPAVLVTPFNNAIDVALDANLNWTHDGGAEVNGYKICFGTDGGGITPPSNIENKTDLGLVTTFSPGSDLFFNTTYYWTIIPYNSYGDAVDCPIWSFTTIEDSVVSIFPYSKDFEGSFPPNGWKKYSGLLTDSTILTPIISGWAQDDWRNIPSPVNKAAKVIIYGNIAKYWLMTPPVNLGIGTDFRLEFDLTLNSRNTSNPPSITGTDDKFAVVISTNEGITWSSANVLRLWDNAGSQYVYNNINYLGQHEVIDITGYSGKVMFGFYGESLTSNADNDLMIDNFKISVGSISPVPILMINPQSLNYGSVPVGTSSVQHAVLNNTGDADLVISGITSSDAEFTFAPYSFPLTVTPGNGQNFDITFTPEDTGTHEAYLQITHNAAGSPTSYSLAGKGVDAGPLFSVDPVSLDFGNVKPGSIASLTVTVTNLGISNPLIIANASIAENEFAVTPSAATIPPNENAVFTVAFTPPDTTVYTGRLVFTDNAPGSPHNVSLTGRGHSSADLSGLVFAKDSVTLLEDDSYAEIMQLKKLTADVHAIQFSLLVNNETDDNTVLTFQNIRKGSDIIADDWVLDYSVFRGPITPGGASKDTVFVLIYNLNQNKSLPAGDYGNLLEVQYRVADLGSRQDNLKSSIRIWGAEASTYNGNPVDITPSTDDLKVVVRNRISSLGDVNGDGCLDVLDLILVVDHIVRKDSLKGEFFTRADIAPWTDGTQAPVPDGIINVQDLSLIQYIILTNVYPDGTTLNGCNYAPLQKISGDTDANVTLYINNQGITAYLNSATDIRGAQIEFGNLTSNPKSLIIQTELGEGYYLKENLLLRTILYDRLGAKYIEKGNHFLVDMPFNIVNPEDITIEKIVLVDMNKNRLENISVNTIYGNPPAIPLDYVLYQNYPNPFNPNTMIKFQVPKTTNVTLKIYDMLGQEVRTLFAGEVQRGIHTVQWDGLNNSGNKMSSGAFICRMQAGEFVQMKKMLLLK